MKIMATPMIVVFPSSDLFKNITLRDLPNEANPIQRHRTKDNSYATKCFVHLHLLTTSAGIGFIVGFSHWKNHCMVKL